MPGINIEEDFVDAMRSIGGKRPVELDPNCANFKKNADLVLPSQNVIVEIKTLMENSAKSLKLKAQIQSLYDGWVADGTIKPFPKSKTTLSTRDLPEKCAHQLIRKATRGVKDLIDSANSQIKVLKKTLNMPDASGLLVLCNSGNPYLAPDVILYCMAHVMKNRYSSIPWLIFMTYNLPVQCSGMAQPADIFCQPARDGFPKMPPELFESIRAAWMAHVSKGTMVIESVAPSEALFDAKHV